MSDTPGRARPTTILGTTAVVDLAVGLVLSLVGLAQDSRPLAIVGVVLLLTGAGVLAFVVLQRDKPQAL